MSGSLQSETVRKRVDRPRLGLVRVDVVGDDRVWVVEVSVSVWNSLDSFVAILLDRLGHGQQRLQREEMGAESEMKHFQDFFSLFSLFYYCLIHFQRKKTDKEPFKSFSWKQILNQNTIICKLHAWVKLKLCFTTINLENYLDKSTMTIKITFNNNYKMNNNKPKNDNQDNV